MAQNQDPFNRPPADIDEALRARIKQFYQYHVTGEYRKAESLVAEDTKDYFYTHNKPKYLGFEITRIDYSDHFTKAKAIVLCEQDITMPMISGRFKAPTPSTWKIEDGKWVWYVDPESIGSSPFGKMKPGPETPPSAGTGFSMSSMPSSTDFLYKQVTVDRKELTLKPGEAGSVTVSNAAPGQMTLLIPSQPAGFEAKIDKSTLQSGEKAVVTVTAKEGAKPETLRLQVDPIGQILTIQLSVK
jgi:hypothetical protein